MFETPLAYAATHSATVEGPMAFAQSLNDELQFMQEETVVTPLRREQPISEAPSNVYVITAEDIRTSGATDIPTLLRRVPGMEVMQTTGADFNVSVRGNNQLRSNKLLVLIDGRSVYRDPQGIVFWKLLPINLSDIRQIEVLKGPISASYGFNAFDGVVNILTKFSRDNEGSSLQMAGGEFGTFLTSAYHTGTYGHLGYRVSAGHAQNNAWENRGELAFRSFNGNLQLDYRFSEKSHLEFSAGLAESNRYDAPLTVVTQQKDQPQFGHVFVSWKSEATLVRAFWNNVSSSSISETLSSLNGILEITDRDGSDTARESTDTYDILGQHRMNTNKFGEITLGMNYRHNASSSNLLTEFTRENRLGLYFQHLISPLSSLQITTLLRYDLNTFINPTISPLLSIKFRPFPNHTVGIGVSLGYRPPTIDENFLDVRQNITIPMLGPLVTATLGSTNLEPERIVSYELDYQGWFLHHRLRTRASIFYNHISDLINFVSTGSNLTDPATAVNTGTADFIGGEIGLEAFLTSWLSGFVNFAYLNISQNLATSNRRGAPSTKVNLGLRGQWQPGLSAEMLVHYVESSTFGLSTAFSSLAPLGAVVPDARIPSYTLVNLRGGYRFWQNQAEVAISVFNALNDRHREHPLGEVIGSRVMGWLTIQLPNGKLPSLPFLNSLRKNMLRHVM